MLDASAAGPAGPWAAVAGALAGRIGVLRAGIVSPLNVSVAWRVPAGRPEPDAERARTGSYSAADRQLLVEIAVPATLPDDPEGFLLSALRDAVELAERYGLQQQIIARPLAELRALVAALEQDSGAPGQDNVPAG